MQLLTLFRKIAFHSYIMALTQRQNMTQRLHYSIECLTRILMEICTRQRQWDDEYFIHHHSNCGSNKHASIWG